MKYNLELVSCIRSMRHTFWMRGADIQFKEIGCADKSARRPISNGLMIVGLVGGLIWAAIDIRQAMMGLFALMAWLSLGFAIFRLLASGTQKPPEHGLAENEHALPHYTVLVPLYNETQMVPRLMASLERLRYPRHKLEIILITEEVDPFTTRAVAMELRRPFRHVIVPKGTPQTKPRALNHALTSCRGDYVTIYDAEDRPHPNQLLAAIAAFRARPDWAAVQAPLDYYNDRDNWLTRQFAIEYAALFHVWIPFLTRLGLPFPLGGTSNHMRRAPLDAIGGWDAHNVTEDADLSFRLAANGHKIGYIHPPTQEEAVSSLRAWRYQRARWMKGYIQTWDVHMAQPFAPGGVRGFARFFTLQLTLGLTLLSALFFTPVITLLLIAGCVLWWIGMPINVGPIYGLTFAISISVGCLIGAIGAIRSGKPHLVLWAITMPAYWTLLFLPTLMAFKELCGAQRFHWHKTRHGVSRAAEPDMDSSIAEISEPQIQHDPSQQPSD